MSEVIDITKDEDQDERHLALFKAWMRSPNEYKHALAHFQKQVDLITDPAGGFAQPEELRAVAQNVANKVNHARILAGVTPCGSSKYRAALADEFSAVWSGETGLRISTPTGDFRSQDPSFGEINAVAVATEWALDDMTQGEEWLVQGLESEFADLETKAFIAGVPGANQPTGMLNTLPNLDPDNARDPDAYLRVDIGAAGSLTAESLGALAASLPAEYQGRPQDCAWLMHPDVYAEVRSFDTSLRAPTRDGAVSTFMDFNCFLNQAMPPPGAGTFSVAVGNFSDGYIFLERSPGTRVTRDSVTDVGKVRFYGRRVVGGTVLNNRAIRFGRLG